jgi:hypothetical protein
VRARAVLQRLRITSTGSSNAIAATSESRAAVQRRPRELHAFYDVLTGQSYSISAVASAVTALPRPPAAKVRIAGETAWIEEGFQLAQSRIGNQRPQSGDQPQHQDRQRHRAGPAARRRLGRHPRAEDVPSRSEHRPTVPSVLSDKSVSW